MLRGMGEMGEVGGVLKEGTAGKEGVRGAGPDPAGSFVTTAN